LVLLLLALLLLGLLLDHHLSDLRRLIVDLRPLVVLCRQLGSVVVRPLLVVAVTAQKPLRVAVNSVVVLSLVILYPDILVVIRGLLVDALPLGPLHGRPLRGRRVVLLLSFLFLWAVVVLLVVLLLLGWLGVEGRLLGLGLGRW